MAANTSDPAARTDALLRQVTNVENNSVVDAYDPAGQKPATVIAVTPHEVEDPINHDTQYSSLPPEERPNAGTYKRIWFRLGSSDVFDPDSPDACVSLPPETERVIRANKSTQGNAINFVQSRDSLLKPNRAEFVHTVCQHTCIVDLTDNPGWDPKPLDQIYAQFENVLENGKTTLKWSIKPVRKENGFNNVPPGVADTVKDAFNKMKNLIFTEVPDPTNLANSYDSDNTIPLKSQHKVFLNIAHPEFVPFIKAFIYKSWAELGASIKINSTFRSSGTQQQVYDRWVAAGKVGPKPARPGTSWHNVGGAIDFNPTLANKTGLSSRSSKTQWLASMIPAIGESVGLRWGGHFSSNYDPIHFDLGEKFSSAQKTDLLARAKEKALLPTKVEFI